MQSHTIQGAVNFAIDSLTYRGVDVDTGHWQGVSTEGKPDLVTKEILNLCLEFPIPHTAEELRNSNLHANLPWAEDHFQERVSRVPSNPGVEYKNWPWWRGQEEAFDKVVGEGVLANPPRYFSHTYQERFWPKFAGFPDLGGNEGIRYEYGDLDSVVGLLRKDPQTRQAYFPIFFPEDTGAVHGGRIPCSLGYHFLLRSGMLHCWYDIRSCDAVRHFRDDLYLACRLVQWILAELKEQSIYTPMGEEDDLLSTTSFYREPWGSARPGTMFFKAHSFHVHKGDIHLL